MAKKRIIIQGVAALVVVWLLVIGIRAVAHSQRVTADKISEEIEEMQMDDWSDGIPSGSSFGDRDEQIQRMASLYNDLDFQERSKAHEQRVGDPFFNRLSNEEKEQFITLTVEKSMEQFMTALDAMSADERRRIVEEGLRDVESGRTEAEMRQTAEYDEDLLDTIAEQGMKAYYEKASADTKLDLAPLIDAMDETMKGLRNRGIENR